MDEPAPQTQPVAPQPIACPKCGESLAIEGTDDPQLVRCPRCEADSFPDIVEEDATVEWEEPAQADSELDGLRIRNVVQLRRWAIRARTYAVVILICCLVMAIQLILTDIQEVGTYGWDRWAILYAISAAATVIGATIASRKAAALRRESNRSDAQVPEHQPQFDQLSDGSHQVKNLEVMASQDSRKQTEDPS